MSNDALIADLAAGLTPVRRRNPWREAMLLAAVGGGELALILAAGLMRPDMAALIATPYMLWKLASLVAVAAVCGVTTLASFSPAASPRLGLRIALGLAGLAAVAGVFVTPVRDLMPHDHHAFGPLCAASILILSLPMLGVLGWLMRRAAPAHPERTGWVAGLAAGSWGALVFALCCPSGDPFYVIPWYAAGCAAVALAARWLLPRGYRL